MNNTHLKNWDDNAWRICLTIWIGQGSIGRTLVTFLCRFFARWVNERAFLMFHLDHVSCLKRDLFHFISFLVEWLVCWFSQVIHWYSFVAWCYFFVDHISGMAMPHLIGFVERAGSKFVYILRALWGTAYEKCQARVDSSRPKPAWRLGARSICDLSDKCQVQMIALLATYSVLVTV